MKSVYVKPIMNMEEFRANEYIAACFTGTCIGNCTYMMKGSSEAHTHTCDGGTFTYFNGVYGQGGKDITDSGVAVVIPTSTAEGSFWADWEAAQGWAKLEVILKAILGAYQDTTMDATQYNGYHISTTSPLHSNGASASY